MAALPSIKIPAITELLKRVSDRDKMRPTQLIAAVGAEEARCIFEQFGQLLDAENSEVATQS